MTGKAGQSRQKISRIAKISAPWIHSNTHGIEIREKPCKTHSDINEIRIFFIICYTDEPNEVFLHHFVHRESRKKRHLGRTYDNISISTATCSFCYPSPYIMKKVDFREFCVMNEVLVLNIEKIVLLSPKSIVGILHILASKYLAYHWLNCFNAYILVIS